MKPGAGAVARVGPNAVLQVALALEAAGGLALADRVFDYADRRVLRLNPPDAMIPQTDAIAVHQALYAALDRPKAEAIARDAGWRTADYLLANRIPPAVQWVLKSLPPPFAAHALIKAIGAHAWTFSGSGRFFAHVSSGCCILGIADNPLATQPCAWHVGVFERLFQVLVSARTHVVETACVGAGAPACRFEARWASGAPGSGCKAWERRW